MKKRCLIVLALALMLMLAAGAAQTVQVDYPEIGIRLHMEETLTAQYGLTVETDRFDSGMVMVLSCMDPEFRDEMNALAMEAIEAGDYARYTELANVYYLHSNLVGIVVMMRPEQYDADKEAGTLVFSDEDALAMGEHNGYLYWMLRSEAMSEESAAAQSEAEIAAWQTCMDATADPDAFLAFIPVEKPATVSRGEHMPSFATKDLDGNDVTEAILAQKDVTVINFWGTYCSPCIGEMPELGAWMRDMPENVQLIGVVTDARLGDTQTAEKAAKILKEANAPFVSLLMDASLERLCESLVGVPTTVLVNRSGEIIGEPILGAQVAKYRQAVEEYLNGR